MEWHQVSLRDHERESVEGEGQRGKEEENGGRRQCIKSLIIEYRRERAPFVFTPSFAYPPTLFYYIIYFIPFNPFHYFNLYLFYLVFFVLKKHRYVMGGADHPNFKRFVDLCGKAYNILRKNAHIFLNLFMMVPLSSSLLQTLLSFLTARLPSPLLSPSCSATNI